MRCADELAIRSLEVCAGRIEVVGPDEHIFSPAGSEISALRAAPDEAITVVEAELAGR